MLLFSAFPPAWVVGTAGLSVAKILDNMEIGHNILHGQWDWMRDPKIHSSTWEWDMASPAAQWKHSHNEVHHTYTNVVGKDNDLGYGIMRVDEGQTWAPFHLGQPIWCFINAVFFEYGIAAYDLDLGAVVKKKQTKDPVFRARAKEVLNKIRKQATKDYVVHPVLSIPTGSFLPTLAANFTANVVRNLWSNSIILCGHFPEGVETFEKRSIEGETKGDWYVRQMLGSANISGSKLLAPDVAATCPTRSSTTSSRTCRPTATPRWLPRSRRSSRSTTSPTARARSSRRSTPPGTRWSASRCPTAGSRPPTPRTPRSSSASSTRWPPVTGVRVGCSAASSRAKPAQPPD